MKPCVRLMVGSQCPSDQARSSDRETVWQVVWVVSIDRFPTRLFLTEKTRVAMRSRSDREVIGY